MSATGGVSTPGGSALRGVPARGGAWWRPPRQLLLQVVCILLECILVIFISIE